MAGQPEIKNMALFCDFENLALGVRDAKYAQFDMKKVLERLLLKGSIIVKLTSSGRTRALARCIPWSRRCILDTPSWACRQYIPREIWPHRQRHQRWLH